LRIAAHHTTKALVLASTKGSAKGERPAEYGLGLYAAGLVELRELGDRRRERLEVRAPHKAERVQRIEVADRLGEGGEVLAVDEA
jgi:hypothetical protein